MRSPAAGKQPQTQFEPEESQMFKNWIFKTRMTALCIALFCAASVASLAQSAVDGAVGGTVSDTSGAVVSGAKVLIRNPGTNAEQAGTTDGAGFFRLIHLQPGAYTLTVTAPGFQTYRSTNVVVQVGALTDVDATLPTGKAETTVDVTGAAPEINTTSPDFSNVVGLEVLQDLPVNNYRWSSYALLTPGVVADSNGFGLLSFRGQSTLQNNVSIDGADDNQAFFAEERGRTRAGYSTAQSAIQEFQVNTSNYSVEYGRAVGGVVNSITKSGTNQIHADFYFRDRDAEWGAKNPYTQIATQATPGGPFVLNVFKPKDWRKQFGGAVGGPIIKDKVFFFVAIDKFKRNFPGTAVASNPTNFYTLPDAALPAGIACNGTGVAAPSAIDLAACTLAVNLNGGSTATVTPTQYSAAAANYNNGITGINTMLGPVPRTGDQNIFFPKVDWQVNSRNRASFEVNRLTWASPAGIQTQATNTLGSRSYGDDFVKLAFGVAKLDTTIKNSLVNEVRYQYGRDFEYEFAQVPTPYEQNNIDKTPTGYINPLGLPPSIAITNAPTFGTPTFLQRPRYPDERRWQIADTMNYNKGNHNIKFGVDFLHTDDLAQNLRTQFGTYSYSSLASYFTDFYQSQTNTVPAGVSAATYQKHYTSFSQALGPLAFDFTTKDYGFFAQDEWKVLPRLSLTIGARYDYEALPAPYASLVNPALPLTASFHADKNNIAPRVGFAYDIFGNGRTSLRGGVGMFYGRTINSTIYSALTSTGNTALGSDGVTPVSQVTYAFNSPTATGAPAFPKLIPSGVAGAATAVYFDKNFQNPYVYQGDLTLEQNVGWNTTMSISYLGALGRDLPQFVDDNLPAASGTITYNVIDTSGKGPLANGTTYTTRYYAKLTTCPSPTGSAPFVVNGRPNCSYGSLTRIYSGVNSSYHALAVIVKHRMTNNLEFQFNYTWSHGLDNGGNNATFNDTNDQVDPANPHADYGNSNQNVPNRFVMYAIYTTPKKYTGFMGYLLNGYQLSPSFAVQNGLPYSAGTSGSPTNALTSVGNASSIGGGVNGSNGAFRIDVLGRNHSQFPKSAVLDFRFSKHLVVKEKYDLELLVESFNVANHQNVTAVNTTAYAISTAQASGSTPAKATLTFNTNAANPTQPLYGTATNSNSNLAYSPRQIQVGAKFHF
jgi:Carboxypeptidase regulatory-like domain/TonB dependent receptor